MTTNDGSVLGTTQIVDHGPVSRRFNLVITCDGYQTAQMTQFANDAQSFVDELFRTPPFEAVQGAFNVFRIDVVSTDAGADDPTTCTGGTGTTAATFFDATFCGFGDSRRALIVDDWSVISVVDAEVPQNHAILVIVNSPIWGGTGGQVGVFSRASGWIDAAIHELGHTAFGLADEYEYFLGCGDDTDRDNHPANEPADPNVTVNSDRDTIKWRDLILPATPMPTTSNADCTQCDPQHNPVTASTVGAFEGADTYHCGAFRPQFDCMMRNTGAPFCAVCQRRIRETMEPYMPRRWFHLSPVAGHPMGADLDASGLGIPARFAVAADFDDDGIPELAIGMQSAGSAGNDFWVYSYDTGAQAWTHLSQIAGHPRDASIDCSTLPFPARFAVTGDFDGDGRPELAAAVETTGSGGNDFWVMKYDAGAQAWTHLSPIAGHPLEADLDCTTLAFPARFAVTGDFDGDGADELLVAPDLDDNTATGVTFGGGPGPPTDSRGNDFWVMKYDASAQAWTHLSPIAGHAMEADLDCSGLGYWAKFAVAADFDGDGADEVVVAPFASGSAGNDLWVFKFDPIARTWDHLSLIAGHPMDADIDCSTLGSPAKLAAVGDFDGDGVPELAIAIQAAASGGNDFWVMKYDAGAQAWTHLSPIAGHPLEADLDCSALGFPGKLTVAGDFDGDGIDELAVAPDAGGTEGNDFWVMKYDQYSQTWFHLTPIAGHAMEADVDCALVPHAARFAVVGDFDGDGEAELAVAPAASGSAGNDFWVMALGAVEPPGDNRAVTQTGKGTGGTIVSLCYPGAPWTPRSKQDAIADIKERSITYYVPWGDGRRTAVRVVTGPGGEYLRTDRDGTPTNNLTSLPDC